VIILKDNRVFTLGDVNGNWGWNSEEDIAGETEATEAKDIAREFEEWIKWLKVISA
jgi:hypothetical protein